MENTLSVKQVPMDFDSFKQWVEQRIQQHGETYILGYSSEEGECPLAYYLRSSLTGDRWDQEIEVSVTETTYRLSGGDYDTTPDWAAEFIEKVDDMTDTDGTSVPVCAAEALLFLQQIESLE